MKLFIWVAMPAILSAAAQDSSEDVGQFFSPPNAVTDTHDYSTNPVYLLGQKQTIKFTTVYQNYKIDLWQQRPYQDAASLGPTVFQTTGGAVTQFDWTVQAYQFDLSYSDMFFFWLSSTSPSTDGSEPQSVTSHYFNITDDNAAPISSSVTSSSPSTAFPSPTEFLSASTPISVPSTTVTTTSTPTGNQTSSGLGAGAQAGIGIGAALAGLAAIIVAFVVYRRWRGRLNHQAPEVDPPQTHANEAWPQTTHAQEYYKAPALPVEMGYQPTRNSSRNVLELST
ncbi:hypothetical protein F5Y10DRAFT_269548 [Nemania abortiva]|nr:hypothetical protein F5Y10DRAFT_269548 [Nemania abortiva]